MIKNRIGEIIKFTTGSKRRILEFVMGILMLSVIYACAMQAKDIATINEEKIPKIVVIDAGHGGNDPGKVGINGALEKDINLQISLKVKDILEKQDISVVLTREGDEGLYDESDSNKKIADMVKRCDIINGSGAVIAVSIHQNSYHSEGVSGAQVFYHSSSTEAKKLAEGIQLSLKDNVDEGNQRLAKSNSSYYLLIHSQCPMVIVECGFLSNSSEADMLTTDEYQNKLAYAISMGIISYVN